MLVFREDKFSHPNLMVFFPQVFFQVLEFGWCRQHGGCYKYPLKFMEGSVDFQNPGSGCFVPC